MTGRLTDLWSAAGKGAGHSYPATEPRKRIDYIGVTFRTRSVEEVREINRRMRADLWPAVEAGKLALPIDRTFTLDEAPAALAHMKANRHFGKIALTV